MAHPLLQFRDAIMASDGIIECGEIWTIDHGWRGYLRAGSKVMKMPPREMRKLGELFRDHPDTIDEVRTIGTAMIEAANAAKAKNATHVIPDGAAQFIHHRGTA